MRHFSIIKHIINPKMVHFQINNPKVPHFAITVIGQMCLSKPNFTRQAAIMKNIFSKWGPIQSNLVLTDTFDLLIAKCSTLVLLIWKCTILGLIICLIIFEFRNYI